jgi:hypothetical protein
MNIFQNRNSRLFYNFGFFVNFCFEFLQFLLYAFKIK